MVPLACSAFPSCCLGGDWIPRGHVAPCAELVSEIGEVFSKFVASQKRVAQFVSVVRV